MGEAPREWRSGWSPKAGGRGAGVYSRAPGRRRLNGIAGRVPPATERRRNLGIGFGIFLMAVGAILAFAVTFTNSVVDWHTVGLIILVAGAVITALSFFFWDSWGGYHHTV